jgi:hypothetical protein
MTLVNDTTRLMDGVLVLLDRLGELIEQLTELALRELDAERGEA